MRIQDSVSEETEREAFAEMCQNSAWLRSVSDPQPRLAKRLPMGRNFCCAVLLAENDVYWHVHAPCHSPDEDRSPSA
jgi:hypothetical protein